MSGSERSNSKIPLPKFLNELTTNGVPVPKAMAIAGKIYKDFNSPSTLSQLTDLKLKAAGVDDKHLRKLVLTALRKAGWGVTRKPIGSGKSSHGSPVAGPSSAPLSAVETVTTPTKRKRQRGADDKNEFLPDAPADEAAMYGSLEFNEVLDEEILKTKSTVVNRAPLMTAWATVVAERMGFQREEALSIASVYTEMNAISKGVSLGIFDEGRNKGMEAEKTGSQPYVEIMGRSALYQTQAGQWRALSNNAPALPSAAFSYVSRAFRQTTPHIVGALRLLAASFTPKEINGKAWALYADFRPAVEGWGKRGQVTCECILGLRKERGPQGDVDAGGVRDVDVVGAGDVVVKFENVDEGNHAERIEERGEPDRKKSRVFSLEEYETALDADTTFNDTNPDFDL